MTKSEPLRVLVACEFSGTVRDAFTRKGHYAVSCDVLPSETPGPHYQGDVRAILGDGWDLMIAHPPCTHLAVSGARWFRGKEQEQKAALEFVRVLLEADIRRIALENPVSVISSKIRKPDQVIQPWWFGHGETKATCLWLKGLPPLRATSIVSGRANRVHRMPPGPDRWKERSRTFPGIAAAMADQWLSPEMEKAGPAGLPRGEQGVKRSSGKDAKASFSALPREGQRPFSFVRLGVLAATIVAALTTTGCAVDRAARAELEWREGLPVERAAVAERERVRTWERNGCDVERAYLRRTVVSIRSGGQTVRKETTETPSCI